MEVITVNEILKETVKDTTNLKYLYCNLVTNTEGAVILQIFYNPKKILSKQDVINIVYILNQFEVSLDEVHVFKILPEVLMLIDDPVLKLELLHCLECSTTDDN